MIKNREYRRIAFIFATIALALFSLYPTYQHHNSPPPTNEASNRAINLGLDLQGGIHLILEVNPVGLSEIDRKDVVERVKEIITNRIDQFGVAEPIIHRQGDWRIVVELPGVQDIERAKNLIGQTARLEFKLLKPDENRAEILSHIEQHLTGQTPGESAINVIENPEGIAQYIQTQGHDLFVSTDHVNTVRYLLDRPDVQALIPKDAQFLWGNKPENLGAGRNYVPLYYAKHRAEMTGEIIQDAQATTSTSLEHGNQPVVNLSTTSDGVQRFSKATSLHLGKRMAIVLDDKVCSAPIIQAKIRDGNAIITGSQTLEEARDLAIILRAGTLPADITIIEDRTVGPSLGHDSIVQGQWAALVGFVLVASFMVLYYGLPGLIANVALLLNVLFILALLAGFHGTLTLPGIAGIILTIGMAVDANVLIFERIREERRAGKPLYTALKMGYARALLTIIDANLTTVITALVLYQFGTGAVRGFALTLMIGIASSMFTAIFVTRTIFETMLSTRPNMSLTFGRLHVFQKANFDIIGKRQIAYTLSILCIAIGLGSAIIKKGYALSIDFSGGTLLECHFEKPVPIEEIRNALRQLSIGGKMVDLSNSEIKQFGNPNDILIRVKEDAQGAKTANAIKAELKTTFADHIGNEQDWLRRQEAVGPKIGSELKWAALNAIGLSLVLILLYIWWRFKHIEFGIGAVIALFHDVFITLGVFSLTDREISLSVVAALLTIVGYSLNDTIVIYDRIREDMALYKNEPISQILNRANNECLSRTVITSGTTLLSVLAILFLGGQVIHDFALALLIGIIAGTYSSVYVATPLVLAWNKRTEHPKPVSVPNAA